MSDSESELQSSVAHEDHVSRSDDGGDRVGGGAVLPRTTAGMTRAGRDAPAAAESSEVPRIKAEPRTLRFMAAPGEESAPASTRLTNVGGQPFQIEDLALDDGERSGFVIYGIGSDIPPGGAVEVQVAFRPHPQKTTSDRLKVIGNRGAKAASIALRGKVVTAEKAQDARASAIVEQARQWKYPAPPRAYSEMLDALTAASELMDGPEDQRPDPFDYTHARELSEPVVRELDEVASFERIAELKRKLGLNGMTQHVVDARIGNAKLAARTFLERSILGGSINGDHTLNQFRAGREEILLLTGEKKPEGSELTRLDAASDTALHGHLAVAGAPLAIGGIAAIAAATPTLAALSESLFFKAGGAHLAGVRAWLLAHPHEALALAEVALGLGLSIGESGVDGFIAQLETPEGIFFVLAQALMDLAHVRGASYTDQAPVPVRTAPRSGTDGGNAQAPTAHPIPRAEISAEPDVTISAVSRQARLVETFLEHVRAARLKTVPMKDMYVGEHLPSNSIWGTQVKYLKPSERQVYKLEVRDGKLYDASGRPFDTTDAASVHSGGEGHAIAVMDAEGNLYASKHQAVGEFHHSSLLAGEPVAYAGEIKVSDGRLIEISNRSGHYWPPQESVGQAREVLELQGIDFGAVQQVLVGAAKFTEKKPQ